MGGGGNGLAIRSAGVHESGSWSPSSSTRVATDALALEEGLMNTFNGLSNLREAHEELSRTIAELESDPEYGEGEFYVAMAHTYHHLNTAWNSRSAKADEMSCLGMDEYYAWRKCPVD